MSDASAIKGLRERLTAGTEDRLGRAFSELLENPLLTGAVGAAFDAREKAAQAQELAMGVLNLPSAADIERLTRRLRSLSQRLEGIEDGVDRISRSLTVPAVEARLDKIEDKLDELSRKVGARAAAKGKGQEAQRANHTPASPASPTPKAARSRAGAARSLPARRKG
jgi:CRP-like cAMP-binding protein